MRWRLILYGLCWRTRSCGRFSPRRLTRHGSWRYARLRSSPQEVGLSEDELFELIPGQAAGGHGFDVMLAEMEQASLNFPSRR